MNTIGCPVCSKPLSVTVAKGRKSNKPFIMLKCDVDGRHFRGFITDQNFVRRILQNHANASLPSNDKNFLGSISP